METNVAHTPGEIERHQPYQSMGGLVCAVCDAPWAVHAAGPALLEALEDVELRCTQARIASTIGKGKDRTEFLRGELERISAQARAAIARASREGSR